MKLQTATCLTTEPLTKIGFSLIEQSVVAEINKMELLGLLLLGGYGVGVWKFWKGFHRTNFSRSFSSQLSLSLLWPALLIANKSYRQNFVKALKG